ncbi:hypothetical protein [Dietzia sp. UBA5065]|jgi:hypothetical protein|uniref:hypothetical protein n=2 Tax=Dietzia TaxID=37914 RepID=UPI0025BCE021|nr:hypothetical protein [Dietzia sp. UBA5065]
MRFDDLPENWTSLPLDDAPLASGVIDLVIGYRDRQRDTMLILPCDQHDVAVPRPILIGEIDWAQSDGDRRRATSVLPQIPAPGFVLALSSKRRLPDGIVRGWLRTVEDQLDASGQSLLAFGVAHLMGVEIVGGRAARNGGLGAVAG